MGTGADYLSSLNDGRRVFLDGELVKDVSAHPAFRQAARSIASLYDIAADPGNRERMTFASPKTGAPVHRAWQIPKTHADLRSKVPLGHAQDVSLSFYRQSEADVPLDRTTIEYPPPA